MKKKLAKSGQKANLRSKKDEFAFREKEASNILIGLQKLLLIDPYKEPIDKLVAKIYGLNAKQLLHIINIANEALQKEALRKVEPLRVASVKVLIAALPKTTRYVKYWLNNYKGKHIYEVHFTFFCFLDQVEHMRNAKEFAEELPSMIGNYLRKVKKEAAIAAWMAGDLLGDHWSPDLTQGVLLETCKHAKYVVGRKGALHGLEHLSARVSRPMQKKILTAMTEISQKDRSKDVREYAKFIMTQILS